MAHRVRAAALQGFVEVSRFVGLDPLKELRCFGIEADQLASPENWLPARSVSGLLEHCAAASNRSDFAMLMVESRTFASLGPISLLLKHEPTLHRIIDQLTTHMFRSMIYQSLTLRQMARQRSYTGRFPLSLRSSKRSA